MLRRHHATVLTLICGFALVTISAVADDSDEPRDEAATLTKPKWEIGQSWTVETVSQRVQGREVEPVRKPVPLRWRFRVAELEQLAGRDCYRIEVQCLARGRIRPKSAIWVDKQSGFMRQYKTQYAVGGKMRSVVESYDHAKGVAAPVIAPISALPIALPAFFARGAKINSFTYTSAPILAGAKAKDLNLVTFAHDVSQTTERARPKSIELIPVDGRPKALEDKPVTQVSLTTRAGTVTQLWQQGQPWPVYVDNRKTKAYLVEDAFHNAH